MTSEGKPSVQATPLPELRGDPSSLLPKGHDELAASALAQCTPADASLPVRKAVSLPDATVGEREMGDPSMNRTTYHVVMSTDGNHKVIVTIEDPAGT